MRVILNMILIYFSFSNSSGIIYHYFFKIIFLCGELLLDILSFVLLLYYLFSDHSFYDYFFLLLLFCTFCWKSINIYINIPIIRIILIFKSNYSYDIFDKSYKILIFCKIAKDINLKKALKLLLTFTRIPRIYFL